MTRMLLKQWFHAGTQWFSGGEILMPGTKPPRRRWLPVLFTLLGVTLLFVPEVRQAISVVSASLGLLRGDLRLSESRLEHVASKGVGVHNAQLLALAAISSSDEVHQRAWADEAIRLDPNLTWINSVVITHAAERMLNSNVAPQQRLEGLADARHRVATLEAWDPGNAAPYLLEAQLAVKDPDIFVKAAQDDPSLLNAEPEWLSAMHKAFAAPRYDSYRKRRFELARVAPEAFGSSSAWSTVIGLLRHPIPNLLMLRAYATYLVGKDARGGSRWYRDQQSAVHAPAPVEIPKDLPAGFGDPARMSSYWQAALFGERMQLADTDIEKLIGIAIEIPAYRSLMVAAQKTHQPELETAIGYRLWQLDHEALANQNPGRRFEANTIAWLAGLISFATLIAILSATLLALSAAYYVAGLVWEKFRIARLERVARAILYRTPAWLLASCLAVFLGYLPFANTYQSFISSSRTPDLAPLSTMFLGFFFLPEKLYYFWTGRGGMYFWSVLIAVLSMTAIWRLSRMVRFAVLAK